MNDMRAIVMSEPGGPEVLRVERVPRPEATPGTVVVRVRAFGLNHGEAYLRQGAWGAAAKVTGIECAGEVHDPGDSGLARGQRVFALMGGMGRTIDGSYAEYVRAPAANVVPVASALPWEELAAIPESYATAWVFLRHNLDAKAGQTIVVRGGTSSLGQAAIDVARGMDVRVLATTRSASPERARLLTRLGAEVLVDTGELAAEVRRRVPRGVDGVFDNVGVRTLPDACKMVRYGGRVAWAGFLGGGGPLTLDPFVNFPSGVHVSFFASAFLFGSADLPLSEIPFHDFVARAESGAYHPVPAHVFDFDDIVAAHRLIESGLANGKIVVRV
jgi:NADPH:quinone reductase-like Zn-dependent oxidoreductase